MPNNRRMLALCVVLLIIPSLALGQSTNATITGQVADPTKAVLPQATVRAINNNTNVRYEGHTNQSGTFLISSLPPGDYRIEVEKTGFKTIIKPDIILHVQDTIELNFEMAVGSASETVTVEGGAPLVNTQDASVSTVVDRHLVENIPLNGRSFQTLIALAPGVVITAANASELGQFSVNGQRADANYLTVDGVSANFGVNAGISLGQDAAGSIPGFSAQGGTNSLVSVDAMQEFRIQTSSFAPEFGRTPGGQISIVTRSGTNKWHGILFDYLRNDVLDANNWFNGFCSPPGPQCPLPKAKERQNDFGGVLGGPIIRDRTFFFVSYEGLRLRLPSTQTTSVPNQATRQNAAAAIQPFLNAFPVANGADLGNGFAQFSTSYSDPSTLDAVSIRVDHSLNSSVSLFGRYNFAPSEAVARSSTVLSDVNQTRSTTHTFTLGSNQRIASKVSNEIRANFSYMTSALRILTDSLGGATPLTDAIFPSGFATATSKVQFTPLPGITLLFGQNAANAQRQLNFLDNLALTAGTHQIKVGVDYRWLAPINGPFNYLELINFSGINGPTGVLANKTSIAAVLASQPTAFLLHNFSFYGQDTWKPRPRLTLTYGLRWDVNPAMTGKTAASDPFTVIGLDNPATMSLAPRGTPLYETTYGNVAPRIGVAYQLFTAKGRELVLRGGFGTFYDLGAGVLGQVGGGFPFTSIKIIGFGTIPLPLTPQQAAPAPFSISPPIASLGIADPHLKLPRTHEWNVAVEQSLGNKQSFSMTYVGAMGRDLLRLNTLCFTAACGVSNPTFTSSVQVFGNTATSDYHALQLQFRRNVARGLQALASYTWAHSLDIASSDTSAVTGTSIKAGAATIDRGNSDFDIRHTFSGALTYDIPAPRALGIANLILGNWAIDSLLFARSATPVNVISPTIVLSGTQFTGRPNVVAGIPLYLTGPQYAGGLALNRAAFQAPAAGQQGNLRRNQLRMFDAWQENLGVRREFKLSEEVGLQFRAEFFNLFNHPNFGIPTSANVQTTSALFGRSTQTLASQLGSGGQAGGFSPLYQIGGPRSIEFALKLTF